MVIVAMLLLAVSADAMAEARVHAEKAAIAYRAGQFKEAAEEYKAAYRLSQKPALLFNMGQVARQAGDYQMAAFYYGQFIEAGKTDSTLDAQQIEMAKELQKQEQAKAA